MNRLEKKILLLFLLVVTTVSAQIGVGTKIPHSDAMIEVKSTNKGLLLPRVALASTTSVSPLSSHVEGMSVYNTATTADVTPGYYYNNGIKWLKLAADTASVLKGSVNTNGTASLFTINESNITTNSIVTVSYFNTANEIISYAITSIVAGSFKVQFAATPASGGTIFYTVVN